MLRITRGVLALPVVAVMAAAAAVTLSVSPVSATTVSGAHQPGSHWASSASGKTGQVTAPAAAQARTTCLPAAAADLPVDYLESVQEVRIPANARGDSGPIGEPSKSASTSTRATSKSHTYVDSHLSLGTHAGSTPRKIAGLRPKPTATTTTSSPVVAAAEPVVPAVLPTLVTATEVETLALPVNPSSSAPVSNSESDADSPQAPSSPSRSTEVLGLTSNPATPLGLNDNLLLAGLVLVFALAVLGLVTAGGRRGGWRHH